MTKRLTARQIAVVFMLCYFCSYITRINFAAIIQEIVTDTGYAKSALSIIPVCLFITYGMGQIINGRIGDIFNPKLLILCGLGSAAVINLIFPFCAGSVPLMCVLWALNGFAQAMMWPPMMKIAVRTMNDKEFGSSMLIISWGSQLATVLIYMAAPLVIAYLGDWRSVFFICGTIGALISAVYFLAQRRIELPDELPPMTEQGPKRGFSFPRAALLPIVFIVAAIILHGMLRDSVTTWMPTYLAEVFSYSNEKSIFTTVVLALFSLATFYIATFLHNRFFHNEIVCAAFFLLLSGLAALVLFLFFDSAAPVAIITMMIITGSMHGVNLMLITYVPKRFRSYGNISTVSGALNACTYIGSASSTWGVAALVEHIGWQSTVGFWLGISALGLVCCLVAARPWKRFYQVADKTAV